MRPLIRPRWRGTPDDLLSSQSLDLQRDALRAAGVDDAVNLYHDLATGVRDGTGLDSTAASAPCPARRSASAPAR